jgi:predicted O-methyltransferase YrrM
MRTTSPKSNTRGEVAEFRVSDHEVAIGRVTLRLAEGEVWDAWKTKAEPGLLLKKDRGLLEELDRFFSTSGTVATAIFELGIWDGGSTAFWFEYFCPDKLVAIDFLDREDDPAFREYVEHQNLSAKLKTFWRTDQSDRDRLRAIVDHEFATPLDLVIDDASHELHATRASFETLFPLLRPGGLYLIEDWAWEAHPSFREPDHPWAERKGLVQFVRDLVEPTAWGEVGRLVLTPRFAVVERR